MKTLSKELSEKFAKDSDVSIQDLLTAIFVFHEVLNEEYPGCIQDHPFVELFSDGSGRVVSLRERHYKNKYEDGILFVFRNLKELVAKSKELIEKHNVVWEE